MLACLLSTPKQRGRRRTGVRHGDLVDLIRVEPDLALPALQHRGGEPLLQQEGDAHGHRRPCARTPHASSQRRAGAPLARAEGGRWRRLPVLPWRENEAARGGGVIGHKPRVLFSERRAFLRSFYVADDIWRFA